MVAAKKADIPAVLTDRGFVGRIAAQAHPAPSMMSTVAMRNAGLIPDEPGVYVVAETAGFSRKILRVEVGGQVSHIGTFGRTADRALIASPTTDD